MKITVSEIEFSAARLVDMAVFHGTDCVFTVSTDDYRIIYIPKGKEQTARAELNEKLGLLG